MSSNKSLPAFDTSYVTSMSVWDATRVCFWMASWAMTAGRRRQGRMYLADAEFFVRVRRAGLVDSMDERGVPCG